MKLKFIGKDGSMGLKHGNTYEVVLVCTELYIVLMWRTKQGICKCPYQTLAKVVENWSDTE